MGVGWGAWEGETGKGYLGSRGPLKGHSRLSSPLKGVQWGVHRAYRQAILRVKEPFVSTVYI